MLLPFITSGRADGDAALGRTSQRNILVLRLKVRRHGHGHAYDVLNTVSILHECLSSEEHKRRYFEECGNQSQLPGSHWLHLSDAFIQSDLQCTQVIHLLSVCVFSGNRTHNLLCCQHNALPLSHRDTMITIAWTKNTIMEVINFLVTHRFLLWSTEERNSYRFGTSWRGVHDDRVFTFGWTILLGKNNSVCFY